MESIQMKNKPQRGNQFNQLKTIPLTTNYFKLDLKDAQQQQNDQIFVYHVKYDPDDIPQDHRRKKQLLFKKLQEGST